MMRDWSETYPSWNCILYEPSMSDLLIHGGPGPFDSWQVPHVAESVGWTCAMKNFLPAVSGVLFGSVVGRGAEAAGPAPVPAPVPSPAPSPVPTCCCSPDPS